MKLLLKALNHGLYPTQLTNTYTCEVIIVLRMHGSEFKIDTKMIIVNHLFQLFQS